MKMGEIYLRYAQTTVGDSRSKSSRRSRSKIYLRSGSCDRFAARPSASANLTPSAQANLAQTTVGDLGFAARSVGISLGPGLVASQRAESKRRSSRPRRKARGRLEYDANGK